MPVRCRSCGVRRQTESTAGKVGSQRIEARRRVHEQGVAGILENLDFCQLLALAGKQGFTLFAEAGADHVEHRNLLPCHDIPPVGTRIGLGNQLIGRSHGHLQR